MAEKEYIEREAAIDALTEQNLVVHMDSVNDGLVASCHRSAQRVIANIPAADVRPVVRGKWIEHNYDPEYLSCDFSCSECNVYLEEYYFGEGQWPGKTDHYFCPNCGADMREES